MDVPQILLFLVNQAIILYVNELSLFQYYHVIVWKFFSKRLASNNASLLQTNFIHADFNRGRIEY